MLDNSKMMEKFRRFFRTYEMQLLLTLAMTVLQNFSYDYQLHETDRPMAGLFRGAAGGTPIRFSSDHNGVAVMKRTLTSVDFAPPVTAPRIRTFGKKSRKFFSF